MEQMTWKEVREKIGLTQAEMASRLGITSQNYCQKENYQRKFDAREVIAIAKMADVDPADIKLR